MAENLVEEEIEQFDEIEVDDSTKRYLKEISRYPLLSNEQQQQLLIKYKQENDQESYQKLVNHNLRLSVFVAKKYINRCKSMSFLDLIQENSIILMDALKKFDITKGVQLSTYVVKAMERNILRQIDNQDSSIRKPVYMEVYNTKYKKFVEKYYLENQKLPSDKEIQDELDINEETLERLKELENLNPTSLNKKIDKKESEIGELESIVPSNEEGYSLSEKYIDEQIFKKKLQDILSKTDYYIIYNRIISKDTKTLEFLGYNLGITRERVRQKQADILKELKKELTSSQKRTTQKYKLSELETMNLNPIDPSLQAVYYYLKQKLDDLTYYILYTKTLNPKEDNIEHYHQKFPLASIDELKEEIKLCTDLKKQFFSNSTVSNIFSNFRKKYTIPQIFELDIKPTTNLQYQVISSFFDNYTFDEISKTKYFNSLDKHQQQLIESYFHIPSYPCQSQQYFNQIERDINLAIMGYYKPFEETVSQNEIRKILKQYSYKFSNQEINVIKYYLLNERKKSYSEEIYQHNLHYCKIKLLKIKYGIDNFFANTLSTEQLEEIKKNYPNLLNQEEWEIIGKYYGYNKEKQSMKSLGQEYNMEYTFIHDKIRRLRRKILNRYYNLGLEEKDIDQTQFSKFLLDPRYKFGEEGRRILKLYFINGMNYKEISEQEGYSTYEVSNFITEGIKKLNFYNYGILKPIILEKEDLNTFFEKNKEYDKNKKDIIYQRYIEGKEIKCIYSEKKYNNPAKNRIVNNFYQEYLFSKVGTIPLELYEKEVKIHVSDTILNEKERELISMKLGIICQFNKTGKQYSKKEILEKLSISSTTYIKMTHDIDQKIRERKLNLINPKYGIISREEMIKILLDKNLPISTKEREILMHSKEINGYPYLNEEELAKKYNMSKGSLKRRYNRAVLSILQYQSNKKKSKISYDADIKPILKYFSTYDSNILKMYYEKKYNAEQISKEIKVSLDKAHEIIGKIRIDVAEILNNSPTAKKFDFEYARKVLDKEDFLSSNSNKDTMIKIFKMLTGEEKKRKYSSEEIKKKLNLEIENSTIVNVMYTVMIAIEEYKLGIKSRDLVSQKSVEIYYETNKNNMLIADRKKFESYLSRKQNFNRSEERIPVDITYQVLKSQNQLVFNLASMTKEDMIIMLNNGKINLPKTTIKSIKKYYQIPERKLMNGRTKQKVLKLLEPLYKIKQIETQKVKK